MYRREIKEQVKKGSFRGSIDLTRLHLSAATAAASPNCLSPYTEFTTLTLVMLVTRIVTMAVEGHRPAPGARSVIELKCAHGRYKPPVWLLRQR